MSLVLLLLIGRDRVTMGLKHVSLGLAVCGHAVTVIVTLFGLAALFVG
jgi:hypothetical protein